MPKLKSVEEFKAATAPLNVEVPVSLKMMTEQCATINGMTLKEFVHACLENGCAHFAEITDEYHRIGLAANEQRRLRRYNKANKKQGQH